MEILLSFLVAFGFSFVGAIPPGTLNLTILQLGLEHKISVAWRFALAAAIIEYPYAWLAVKFEKVIIESANITENFQLITGLVMIILGVINLRSKKSSTFKARFQDSGFRKGLLLGILNPLALPYWVAMTAYIRSQHWLVLNEQLQVYAYLLGICMGTLVLLMVIAYLSRQVIGYFQGNTMIKKIPGITLLILGIYALAVYFFGKPW